MIMAIKIPKSSLVSCNIGLYPLTLNNPNNNSNGNII